MADDFPIKERLIAMLKKSGFVVHEPRGYVKLATIEPTDNAILFLLEKIFEGIAERFETMKKDNESLKNRVLSLEKANSEPPRMTKVDVQDWK